MELLVCCSGCWLIIGLGALGACIGIGSRVANTLKSARVSLNSWVNCRQKMFVLAGLDRAPRSLSVPVLPCGCTA